MSREIRFKQMQFYDKGTGQTVFIGPGTYNAHECFARLKAVPSTYLMVMFVVLTSLETDFFYPRSRVRRLTLHNGRRLDQI